MPSFRLSNVGTNKCLDVPGGSTTSGQALQLWPCTNASNQLWTFSQPATDQWEIRSVRSDQLVTVRGNRIDAETEIEQYTAVPDASNQRWSMVLQNDGSYALRSVSSNMCIDLYRGDTSNGAGIVQYFCTSSATQSWRKQSI